MAKTLEDVIINSFCNYNLDSGYSAENFPSFLYSLVEEMIQFGEDMREKAVHKHGYKRTRSKRLKRPRPASDNALKIGSSSVFYLFEISTFFGQHTGKNS